MMKHGEVVEVEPDEEQEHHQRVYLAERITLLHAPKEIADGGAMTLVEKPRQHGEQEGGEVEYLKYNHIIRGLVITVCPASL
jgi:hypothetical protein